MLSGDGLMKKDGFLSSEGDLLETEIGQEDLDEDDLDNLRSFGEKKEIEISSEEDDDFIENRTEFNDKKDHTKKFRLNDKNDQLNNGERLFEEMKNRKRKALSNVLTSKTKVISQNNV